MLFELGHQRLPRRVSSQLAGVIERRELFQVLAGAERLLTAADEHEHAHVEIVCGLGEFRAQPPDSRSVESVTPLPKVDTKLLDRAHGSL